MEGKQQYTEHMLKKLDTKLVTAAHMSFNGVQHTLLEGLFKIFSLALFTTLSLKKKKKTRKLNLKTIILTIKIPKCGSSVIFTVK